MTLAELIAQQRAALAAQLTARSALTATLQQIRDTLTDPVPAEVSARIDSTIAARAAIDADIDQRQARIADLIAEQNRDDAVARLQREVTPGATRVPYDQVARVGAEARTYRRDTDPEGRQFVRDLGLLFLHGGVAGESSERLSRHMSEERVERGAYLGTPHAMEARAAGTGAFAGLTVPQYLTELYAPLARALRPFADACNGHVLPPDGMTLNLSRITTGTSVALQASENAAVSNVDIDDTLLTINVQTNAGQQTLSRQAIERGTGTEDVTVQDLFRAYSTTLDSTLLNQASTGMAASAATITFTTPVTGPGCYGKITAAASAVEAAMLNMASGENLAVMHSRRWYSLQSSLSATWPLIGQPGIATQQLGDNYQVRYGMGVRGILPNGLPVIVDNNIVTNLGAGTNQDEIYVADKNECHLWEDPNAPVFIRAEQPSAASLGVLFVLYGYFAYTFSRYAHNQKVTGAGLVPPLFDGS